MKHEFINNFFRELQQKYFQTLEFKRVRRTFSRDKGTYWERFNFYSTRSTRYYYHTRLFYLHVGVEFKDLAPTDSPLLTWPPTPFRSGFPHTHWIAKIESIVPDETCRQCKSFEVFPVTEYPDLSVALVQCVTLASERLALSIEDIREEYLRHLLRESSK